MPPARRVPPTIFPLTPRVRLQACTPSRGAATGVRTAQRPWVSTCAATAWTGACRTLWAGGRWLLKCAIVTEMFLTGRWLAPGVQACDVVGGPPLDCGAAIRCQSAPSHLCSSLASPPSLGRRFNQRHTPQHRMVLVRPRITAMHMLQVRPGRAGSSARAVLLMWGQGTGSAP